MADRLGELLRQRALLQEHLAWLDCEIAAASGQPAGAPSASPAPPAPAGRPPTTVTARELRLPIESTTTMPTAAAASSAGSAASADEILEQYRVAPDSLRTDVRKGCFLYFAAAFGVLFLVIAILYFAFRL